MKTIFTVGILLFLGNNLPAQSGEISDISMKMVPKAKLLYETEKGLVYALPQDNMKCLIPDIKSNMPIASAKIPGYIPNPLHKNWKFDDKIIPHKNFSAPNLNEIKPFVITPEKIDSLKK